MKFYFKPCVYFSFNICGINGEFVSVDEWLQSLPHCSELNPATHTSQDRLAKRPPCQYNCSGLFLVKLESGRNYWCPVSILPDILSGLV